MAENESFDTGMRSNWLDPIVPTFQAMQIPASATHRASRAFQQRRLSSCLTLIPICKFRGKV